ncbi:DoxX family protein [Bacillus sp. SD088]|uniref:DoxX family protein n=1 Tax=Bacillus sp. SD088 TaxID=2782012 RepID=UPI001A974502|nr:DoxX family protein [Bacillus sp. SD088]MBO0992584.1 DoxX family protein [Bacillus sp. SD088]
MTHLPLKYLRYVVAYIFIVSGLMKIVSSELGSYFVQLGLPFPEITLYIVAFIEIIAGVCLLLKIVPKLATIPLMAIMLTAIVITKIPILSTDFMKFLFEARLDITVLVLLIVLYKLEID